VNTPCLNSSQTDGYLIYLPSISSWYTNCHKIRLPLDKADGATGDTVWAGKLVDTRPGSMVVPGKYGVCAAPAGTPVDM